MIGGGAGFINDKMGMISKDMSCSSGKGVVRSGHIFTPGSMRMSCRSCVGDAGPCVNAIAHRGMFSRAFFGLHSLSLDCRVPGSIYSGLRVGKLALTFIKRGLFI